MKFSVISEAHETENLQVDAVGGDMQSINTSGMGHGVNDNMFQKHPQISNSLI